MLQDKRSRIREVACHSLAKLKDPEAIEPLFFTLNDDSSDVSKTAAKALVAIGDPSLKTLMEGLKDENSPLRWRAAWGLARLQNPQAFDELVVSLEDAAPEVRWNAVFTLGIMGGARAVKDLEKLLDDGDRGILHMARVMIEEIETGGEFWKKNRR